jgi:parvulin-like peptidyl-prolyl isomerase
MRRIIPLLLLASALPAAAEVVDRIAASVAGQVVTLSDIRRHIRITAFLEKAQPEYSQAQLRQAAELLIDQALIRREAELSRYPAPSVPEIDQAIDQLSAGLGLDRQAVFAQAREYGFSDLEMRDLAAWRLTVIRFIDYRFRPSVQVSEADISRYYNEVFLPQLRARSPEASPPPLDSIRERIIDILNTELATQASQIWLEQSRKQTRIRYFEEAFK